MGLPDLWFTETDAAVKNLIDHMGALSIYDEVRTAQELNLLAFGMTPILPVDSLPPALHYAPQYGRECKALCNPTRGGKSVLSSLMLQSLTYPQMFEAKSTYTARDFFHWYDKPNSPSYIRMERYCRDTWKTRTLLFNEAYVYPGAEPTAVGGKTIYTDTWGIYAHESTWYVPKDFQPDPLSIRAQLEDVRAGKNPRMDAREAKRLLKFRSWTVTGRWKSGHLHSYLYLMDCANPKFKQPTMKAGK